MILDIKYGLPALLCVVLAMSPTAFAQQMTPSQGLPIPDSSLATQSDSASLEVNPAGLGFLEGFEAAYGFFLPSPDFQGTLPSGHSLMMGTGGQAGGLGVGVQWVDNPLLRSEREDYLKLSVGGALAGGRYFSLGGGVNYFSSRTDERLNRLMTVDLGAQWRPSRYVGVGLLARDVTPAFLDPDQALPMRLGVGVAVRLFDGRLVLDTEIHSARRDSSLRLAPRLAVEPIKGLRLFGSGQVELPAPFVPDQERVELSALSIGAEVSTGSFGLMGASYQSGIPGVQESQVQGFSYRMWAGTPQKRSLFSLGERWVLLKLNEEVSEQAQVRLFGASTRPFMSLITDLEAMADDPTIAGVVLEVGDFNLGYGQLWELHQAFERLHRAGKESLAILQLPSTKSIYASAAAQRIWMLPTTPYAPTGLQVEFVSYAGFFDRLGVEAEFLRIGDYKSAPESYVMPGPSDPALEQTGEYLDAIYEELTDRIAGARGREGAEMRQIIDETPLYPARALDKGLVDALVYEDELEDRLKETFNRPIRLEKGYQRYEIADERWGGRPEIGIVYIDGVIVDGESGQSPFGGSSITGAAAVNRVLRKLREDRAVKAVVLRIDSPGGSAVGSDLIYRELRKTAQVKPVIASMASVAASGGYYVAAGADEIFATPVTLTGSIGIFTGKFNVEELAARFGINVESEVRGDRAGVYSFWRPWNDTERQGVIETLDYLYQLFLNQVAQTRPLSAQEVDQVARGRVWTGAAAEQAQLVDRMGGLLDALRRAEELAGLKSGEAVYVDHTGAGGRTRSPGVVGRLTAFLIRAGLLKLEEDVVMPTGELPRVLSEVESALLWPLYFNSGEAVFMPPYAIVSE